MAIASNGYTTYGYVKYSDWLGNVINGELEVTKINNIVINLVDTASFNFGSQQGFNIATFPEGVLLPTTPGDSTRTTLRIQTDSTDGFFFGTSGRLQLFGDSGTYSTTEGFIDAIVEVINNPQDVSFKNGRAITSDYLGFTASKTGIEQLTLTMKNSVTVPPTTVLEYTATTNTNGSLTTTNITAEQPIILSLENDPNRFSNEISSVTISDDSLTTQDLSHWNSIYHSRGTEHILDKGFNLTIGTGYGWFVANPDVTLNLTGNSQIIFSGPQKGELWNGQPQFGTARNTSANPVLGNINNGSVLTTSNTTNSNAGRTTLTGSHLTDGRFIITYTDSGLGWYSVGSGFNFQADTPSSNFDYTINLDFNDGGQVLYEPRAATKQFTAPQINWNNGSLQFNGGSGSGGTALGITEDYERNTVPLGNMDFKGNQVSAIDYQLGAFRPRPVWFKFFNPKLNSQPYFGDFTYSQTRETTFDVGGAVLSRLWNPEWFFNQQPITDFSESYYYGTTNNPLLVSSNLVPVKEIIELGNIGTVGSNRHPFNNGISISVTEGLADARVDGTNLNKYQSNNTGTPIGWGDGNSDYNGLGLVFAKSLGVNTSEFTNGTTTQKQNAETFNSNWFSYTRRDGFRPFFTTRNFNAADTEYTIPVQMDPLLDLAWQANTPAGIITKVNSIFATTGSYNSTLNTLTITTPNLNSDWNKIYQGIEYLENNSLISNARIGNELRPILNGVQGRFARFIDTDLPVDSSSRINMPNYDLNIKLKKDLLKNTDSNNLLGINMGTKNLVIESEDNSLIKTVNVDIQANNLTTSNDATTSDFKFENSNLNITGNIDIPGSIDNVIINTSGTTDVSLTTKDSGITSTGAVTLDGDISSTNITTDSNITANGNYDTGILNAKARIIIEGTADDLSITTTAAGLFTGGLTTTSTGNIVGNTAVGTIDRCTFDVDGTFSSNKTEITTGTIRNEIKATGETQIGICEDSNVESDVRIVTTTSVANSKLDAGTSAITQITSGTEVNSVNDISSSTVSNSQLNSTSGNITTTDVSATSTLVGANVTTKNISGESTITATGNINTDSVNNSILTNSTNSAATIDTANVSGNSTITSGNNYSASGSFGGGSIATSGGNINITGQVIDGTLTNTSSTNGTITISSAVSGGSDINSKGNISIGSFVDSSTVNSESGNINVSTANILNNSILTNTNSTLGTTTVKNVVMSTINSKSDINAKDVSSSSNINSSIGDINMTSIIDSEATASGTTGSILVNSLNLVNETAGTQTYQVSVDTSSPTNYFVELESDAQTSLPVNDKFNLSTAGVNVEGTIIQNNASVGIVGNRTLTVKFSTADSNRLAEITTGRFNGINSKSGYLLWDSTARFVTYNSKFGFANNVTINSENTFETTYLDGTTITSNINVDGAVTINSDCKNSSFTLDNDATFYGQVENSNIDCNNTTTNQNITFNGGYYNSTGDDDANDRITVDGTQANVVINGPIKTSRFGEDTSRLELTNFSDAENLRDIEVYAVNKIDLPATVSENSVINTLADIQQPAGITENSTLTAGTTANLFNLKNTNLTATNDITLTGTTSNQGTIISTSGDVSAIDTVFEKITNLSAKDLVGSSADDTTFNLTGNLSVTGNLSDCNLDVSGNISGANINICPTISATNISATSLTTCPSVSVTNTLTTAGDITSSNITSTNINCQNSLNNSLTLGGSYTGTGNFTNTSTSASTVSLTTKDITNCPSVNVRTKLNAEDIMNSTFNLTQANTIATQSTVDNVTSGTFNVGDDHNLQMDSLISGTITGGDQISITTVTDGTIKDAKTTLITNLADGTIENTNLSLTNPNTANTSFNDVIFKDVKTNTLSTPYRGTFTNGCEAELTNSGTVFYSTNAIGSLKLTKGPATQTIYTNQYSVPAANATSWITSGDGTVLRIDDEGALITNGITIPASQTTFVVGNITYTRGPFVETRGATGLGYSLTKQSGVGANVLVDPGSLTVTIDADDGTNFTDNITLVEDPFIFTVVNPDSASITLSRLEIEYTNDNGTKTIVTASGGNDIVITQLTATKGNEYKITYTRAGFVWQLLKGTFTGLDESISIPQLPNAYPSTTEKGTFDSNGVTIDSNNILTVSVENVRQVNVIANRVLTEALVVSESTHQCIRAQDTINIFVSDGATGGFAADSDIFKVVSTTASSSPTKETFPYFRPLQTSEGENPVADIFLLVANDAFLGISTIAPELSVGDVSRTLNTQLNSQFNARIVTKDNEESKGKLIPVDPNSTQDVPE